MVGVAILSGLRRGELFALRWKDIDERARLLTMREAVYDGRFDTPKTEAGSRQIPLSSRVLQLIVEWKADVKNTEPDAQVFGTRVGTAISPNNVSGGRSSQPAIDWDWPVTRRCSMGQFATPSRRSPANCSRLFTNPKRRRR